MPQTGPPAQSGPGSADTAQLGLASFNTFCAGAFALGLLLRLDNTVPLSWGAIFLPFLVGHATTAGAHVLKRRAYARASVDVNPSIMLVRVRDAKESLYKLLQSCGVMCSCGMMIVAIAMGPPSDASDAGSTTPVVGLSYSAICLPIWLVWAAETWVWLQYRKYRNAAVQGGLTPNHAAIKIRGHDEIFFYNLMVTLVARMLDGAYTCTWMTLFTVVWVQLLLIAVLYVICFLICLIGLGLSHTQRFQPALAAYRKVFLKSLLLVTFGSFTVVLYWMFWYNLALRMDGDVTVSHAQILSPLIIKVGPELLSSFILYTTGGHTTIHDSIRSTTEEGERVQWEREKEEYAAIAPKRLVQQSATFFKAIEPGADADVGGRKTAGASRLRLRAPGGSSGGGAKAVDSSKAEEVEGGAPPGGVWSSVGSSEPAMADASELTSTDGQDASKHLSAATGVHQVAAEERADAADSVTGEGSPRTTPPAVSEGWGGGTAPSEDSEDGYECDICLSAPREVALLPCGHGGMCAACAYASVELPGHSCPHCRQKVLMVAELRPEKGPDGEPMAAMTGHGGSGGSDVETGCGPNGPIFLVVRREQPDTSAREGGSGATLSQQEP
jgi:hypothetical protein